MLVLSNCWQKKKERKKQNIERALPRCVDDFCLGWCQRIWQFNAVKPEVMHCNDRHLEARMRNANFRVWGDASFFFM